MGKCSESYLGKKILFCKIEISHSAEENVSKSSLLQITRKLVLNVISIDDTIFKYTCNEAGIKCNPDMHTRGLMGYLQEN